MKKSKVLSVALAASVLASTMATGCSGGNTSSTASGGTASASNSPVSVTFWGAAISDDRTQFFKDFQKKVHETYPNITLDFLGVPGNLDDYRQKLDVAINAGTAPDITNDFRPALVTNGYYQNLNEYFSKWDKKDEINSELVTANKTYDPKGTGLYALPYSSQTWNLWVRPDWLKEAGMSTPANWNDFFTSVQKMTDKSKNRYGLAIRGGGGSANTLEMLMYSYSGITNYFTADGKSTINDPKNVEFVQKYLGCYNKYTAQDDLTKGWTQLANAFQSDKAGIVVHNLGSGASMTKAFKGNTSKYQAAMFPASAKGYVLHPGLMPLGLSMSSSSKNKDAAWKVMTLYLSKDVNLAYAKLYGEIPANTEATKDSFFKNTQYMSVGVQLETSKNVKFGGTPYYLPEYTNIQTQMEPMIQKVMSGQMSAKDMLDKWASLLQKALADYKASVKK